MIRKLSSLLLALTCLAGLLYTIDLGQKNHESLFMERSDYQSHLQFLGKLASPNILLLATTPENQKQFDEINEFIDDQFDETGHVLTSSNFKSDDQALIKLKSDKGEAALVILPEDSATTNKLVKEVVPKARSLAPNFAFSGVSYINYELDESSKVIQTTLFPLTFFLCFVGLFLTFRKLSLSLLIFLPSLLVTGLSLALIKLTITNLDMVTSTIPLMTFILNLTMGLHLCLTRMESNNFSEVIKEKKRPILLMVTTTAVGFGSLAFSEIPVIRSFALLSCALILITHLVHIILVAPFYDQIFPKGHRLPKLALKISSQFYHLIKNIKPFMLISVLLFASGLFIARSIEIHTQAAHYFPNESVITKGQDFIHDNFIGNPNLEILIDLGELTYERALELNQLESSLEALNVGQIISAGTLVKEANRVYTHESTFPPNQFAWSALLSQLPSKMREGLYNERYYRLSVLGPLLSSEDYQAMVEKIRQELSSHKFTYEFGGLYYTLIRSQHNLINTLALSFSSSLLIMAIIAFAFYPKIKIFGAFLFVNIIPLGLSLIAFKVIGLSFNVATIMTFSISLGMIVDGTFHIIHSFMQNDPKERLLASTLSPILISSTILGLCFLTFAPIGFLPIREFGLALAINAFIGLFFDLAVLPKILAQVSTSYVHRVNNGP